MVNKHSPASTSGTVVVVVVYLTLTDPLIRIQPWSQGRRNQTKSNRKSEISRGSRQKITDKKAAGKGHRRDKQKILYTSIYINIKLCRERARHVMSKYSSKLFVPCFFAVC